MRAEELEEVLFTAAPIDFLCGSCGTASALEAASHKIDDCKPPTTTPTGIGDSAQHNNNNNNNNNITDEAATATATTTQSTLSTPTRTPSIIVGSKSSATFASTTTSETSEKRTTPTATAAATPSSPPSRTLTTPHANAVVTPSPPSAPPTAPKPKMDNYYERAVNGNGTGRGGRQRGGGGGRGGLYDVDNDSEIFEDVEDAFDEDSMPFPDAGLSPIPMVNSPTVVAGNVANNNIDDTTQRQGRARTLTGESNVSSASSTDDGSVSKHTLVRLMREQVDLVKSLTNAQIAQKRELEKVKREKRELEQQQNQQQQQQQKTARQGTHYDMEEQQPSPPTRSTRLNLPVSVQRDTSDSRSVSSRSFVKYLSRGGRGGAPRARRHPDAEYFTNSNSNSNNNNNRHRAFSGESNTYDDGTLTNGNPSAASTLMPSAIMIDPSKVNSTGAFGVEDCHPHHHPHHPAYTGPGAYPSTGYSRDRIEITRIPERNVIPESEGSGCLPKTWWFFSRLCTLFVPDVLLCCIGRHARVKKGMSPEAKKEARASRGEARQAWREKVAIFVVMIFFSACFIGVSGVVPMVLCRETSVFTMDEIRSRDRAEDWTAIFGTIYDIREYAAAHPGGDQIRELIARDASKVFPRRPAGRLPGVCIDRDKGPSREPSCDEFDEVDQLVNLYCHTSSVGFPGVRRSMGGYERGTVAHRPSNLENDPHTEWITIYGRIYNVTRYLDSIRDDVTGEIDVKSDDAFLSDELNSLIVNKRGEDATMVYEALYDDDIALSCLDDLFYVGVMDEKDNILCRGLNIAMYSVMIIIAAVLATQCLCSLVYLFRLKRTISRDDTRSKIIVMVPCYSEGDKELSKTINSVMDTSYPDDNKVLLVVADGNITGKGERVSTPETLSKILGYKMSSSDRIYKCKSIGDLTENRAKLYYGIYKDAGKELKYLVIVKCGVPSEKGSARAGNRGKRDSQLLFSGLLNRFHHGRELNDLDNAIKHALDHLQLPLDEVRYLMAIDADTRVDRESLSHMTYSMNKNDHILALCGETKVDNKAQSWVTMIQVFEYYTNHHMKKAFESVFGCVTCLPGCFTMYRLFSDDGRPLLSCDDVYQRYATNDVQSLHDKNLYHLGEDRMLTTLLLRYFPDMRLSFIPEATCYTIVPHTFSVLLSQRRRWINSTFHNMLELMRVNTMCGVCCLSMKSIVILDLVATLILPASLIYVGYIVYITFWMGEPLSLLMLVVWGIVIGVQVVVFLLRSRWDYWWWFFVFVIAGVPVFYFILPLYSFWHMDDFSWGATRQVSGPANNIGSTKSGDETIVSERHSPTGFEVVGSKVMETGETDREAQRGERSTKRSGQKVSSKANRDAHHHAYAQAEDAGGRLNLKPKLHGTAPIDMDNVSADDSSCAVSATSTTRFDPKKYRDAEEAKQARRTRRGEI